MTCEEYRVLLDQLLDGTISPEDEKKLLMLGSLETGIGFIVTVYRRRN